jgi:hypothetical protein
MLRASKLVMALVGMLLASIAFGQHPGSTADDPRTEANIRELVRRGAVVKRFAVLESETVGLLVRLKPDHLSRSGTINPEIVRFLRPLPELTVELRGLSLSDDGLNELLDSVPLAGLDVSGSQVTNGGLKPFESGRSRLRLLDLSFTRVDDDGLTSLAALSELRHLSLIGCRGVTDQGLESVSRCKRLRELYLAQTPVGSAAVATLRRSLPQCRIER